MPKQGQSVESCIVSEFRKKPGDTVKVGDVLFGYETDKATFEEEAKVEGTVLAVFFNDGDEIPVLTNVMVIGNPGESFEEFAPKASAKESAKVSEGAPSETCSLPGLNKMERPDGEAGGKGREATVSGGTPSETVFNSDAPASPRARKLAAEKFVNLDFVAGSGPGGRILARDVEAAAAAQGRLSGLAKAMMEGGGFVSPGSGSGLAGTVRGSDLKAWEASGPASLPGEGVDHHVVKLSNMRKLIAKSMYASLQNSAQLTHMLAADASRLQELRAGAKKALAEGRIDANVTINDLVCFAVIKALQKFPNVNSHCLGDSMRLFDTVNLGMAVDTERGLMVPSVAHAEKLDIVSLSKALKKVADECKKGSVNPDVLSSEAASFTVSNLGGFGVEWFTPIINLPQSAILGVGTMVPRPKLSADGKYEFHPYMGLSLTYDHRAIDGGEATRFLKQVATEIETLEIMI